MQRNDVFLELQNILKKMFLSSISWQLANCGWQVQCGIRSWQL